MYIEIAACHAGLTTTYMSKFTEVSFATYVVNEVRHVYLPILCRSGLPLVVNLVSIWYLSRIWLWKKSCIPSSLVISDTSTTVWSTSKTCILPTNVLVHPYATEYYKHCHKPSNMRSGIGNYTCFSLERQQGIYIVPILKVSKSPW